MTTLPATPPNQRKPTIREYLIPVRRRWPLILAVVLICTGAAVAVSLSKAVSYTAATKVYVAPGSGVAGGAVSTVQGMADEAQFLTSTETAQTIAKQINYPGSAAGLAGSVHTSAALATNFLSITSTQASAALAVRVVNAYAREFVLENAGAAATAAEGQIAALRKQLKTKAIRDNGGQVQEIDSEISQLQSTVDTSHSTAQQLDVATAATASTRAPVKYGLLAAVGSLIGAILLAYGFEALDPRMRTAQDAAATYRYPVLAMVMRNTAVDADDDGQPTLPPASREVFRHLQITLDLQRRYTTILVTSAVPGEGKSTVARNLALALAEDGRQVGLIDADLRKPRLTRGLGLESEPGLAEVLDGSAEADAVIVSVDTAIRNAKPLRVIPAGMTADIPPSAFAGQRFRNALEALTSRVDVVVIDSTPIVAVADALPVAGVVDAVVLVARNATDSRSAERAAEALAHVPNVNIIGLVVNDVDVHEVAGYGYGRGYGYGDTRVTASP